MQLLQCPFCGGSAEVKDWGPSACVVCLRCEAEGPDLFSAEEAVEAWNTRFFGGAIPDKGSLSNDLLECKTASSAGGGHSASACEPGADEKPPRQY